MEDFGLAGPEKHCLHRFVSVFRVPRYFNCQKANSGPSRLINDGNLLMQDALDGRNG